MGMSLSKGGYMAEINVTPFVDVMLVLLIIFMVTAPMMTQGLDVDLPQTKAVKSLPKDTDHLVITVQKDGTIALDQYQVEMPQLQDHLKRLVVDQKKQLYMRADKEVPYGIVVQVMGEIRAAGIDKLGIVAEEQKGPKPDKAPAQPEKKG